MNGIAMGTTPTIKIKIEEMEFDKLEPNSMHVYFFQSYSNHEEIKRVGEDIEINEEEKTISTYLTQEETLKLNPSKPIFIEARWLFNEELPNGDLKAGKTNILQVPVINTLSNEVIT